jgi:hypothetical protein
VGAPAPSSVCTPPPFVTRFPRDFAPRPPASPETIREALVAVRTVFPVLLADLVLDGSDDQQAQVSFEMRDVPDAFGREGIDPVLRCIQSEFDRLDIPQVPSCSFRLIR